MYCIGYAFQLLWSNILPPQSIALKPSYIDQITSRQLFAMLYKCKNESNIHKLNALQCMKNWVTPLKAKHNVSEELHHKKLRSWIILGVFLDISVGVGGKPSYL